MRRLGKRFVEVASIGSSEAALAIVTELLSGGLHSGGPTGRLSPALTYGSPSPIRQQSQQLKIHLYIISYSLSVILVYVFTMPDILFDFFSCL